MPRKRQGPLIFERIDAAFDGSILMGVGRRLLREGCMVKLVLDESPRDGAVRVDLAWNLFFDSKPSIPEGHGGRLLPFTNWLWDELGRKAGRLNRNSRAELYLTIPALEEQALYFLLRIASFWSDDV